MTGPPDGGGGGSMQYTGRQCEQCQTYIRCRSSSGAGPSVPQLRQPPAPPRPLPPGKAVWIRNVVVNTTRHRWRNRNGGPKDLVDLHSRKGKGRAASGH